MRSEQLGEGNEGVVRAGFTRYAHPNSAGKVVAELFALPEWAARPVARIHLGAGKDTVPVGAPPPRIRQYAAGESFERLLAHEERGEAAAAPSRAIDLMEAGDEAQ